MTSLMNYGPSTAYGDALAGTQAPIIFDAHLQLQTPRLVSTLQLWRAKCAGRLMPQRNDFSMRDLAPVLGQICVLDIVEEGARTRFLVKIMGSVLERYLLPMTGKFVDEAVPPYFVNRWNSVYFSAISARAPMRVLSRTEFKNQLSTIGEGLVLPLALDGQTPSGLLIVLCHYQSDEQNPRQQAIRDQLKAELALRAEN